MKKKKITRVKDNKFNKLDENQWNPENAKIFGIGSIFLNITASIIVGKSPGPNAQKFLSKVIDAFDEIYERSTPIYLAALRRLDCFERYVKALEEPNKSERKRIIDYVISDVERWKLFKNGKLGKEQRAHLHEELPKWRNKRVSKKTIALERSESLFGKHYGSLKKHRREREKYEKLLNVHCANDIEHDFVAFVTLQHCLHIKGDTLKDMLKILWRDGFKNAETPANRARSALDLCRPARYTLADSVYPELKNRGHLNR